MKLKVGCWLIRIIFLAALCASFFFNAVSWTQLQREYREMKSVRLDPLGTNQAIYPPDAPSHSSSDAPLILFIGDSRARAWPAPQIDGWRFANRGIDGQTTAQIVGRFADQIGQLRPKVIVLECGINDLTAIGVLPDDRARIVSDSKENLRKMITAGRGIGATVIVTTIFPSGHVTLDHRPFWSSEIAGAIRQINDDLRSIHESNVIILDADTVFLEYDKIRQQLYIDTLHVTPAAYAELNATLKKLLESLHAGA